VILYKKFNLLLLFFTNPYDNNLLSIHNIMRSGKNVNVCKANGQVVEAKQRLNENKC